VVVPITLIKKATEPDQVRSNSTGSSRNTRGTNTSGDPSFACMRLVRDGQQVFSALVSGQAGRVWCEGVMSDV